jgi:hypothetical protein
MGLQEGAKQIIKIALKKKEEYDTFIDSIENLVDTENNRKALDPIRRQKIKESIQGQIHPEVIDEAAAAIYNVVIAAAHGKYEGGG